MTDQSKRVSSVKNVPDKYPDADFTEQSIRWWIFNAEQNGFDRCIIRLGRKILIDLDRFDDWIESHRCVGQSA